MTIVHAAGPEHAGEVIAEALADLFRHPELCEQSRIRFRLGGLAFSNPIGCWSAGIGQVARGHLLPAARFRHWRYLLLSGNHAVGDVDVLGGGRVRARALTISGTRFASALLAAYRVAAAAAVIRRGEFQPRILKVSSTHFHALWMHAPRTPHQDRLIELPLGGWKARPGLVTEKQALAVLQPRAKRWIAAGRTMQRTRRPPRQGGAPR